MKLHTTLALAFGLAGVCHAGPNKITVHGGTSDQTNAIVQFDAGKDWEPAYLLAGPGDEKVMLQIDDTGHATMVIPRIAKGEARIYQPMKYEAVAGVGVAVTKAGRVLKFTHGTAPNDLGHPMFDYQMEPGDVPAGVPPVFMHGAHLHPVYSPGGHLVTGNHPADHRWHRGIWMAWTHTEYEGQTPDFWNMGKVDSKEKDGGKLLAEVRFASLVKSWGGPVHGGFVSRHRFIDHNSGTAKDVLNETWEVTAYVINSGTAPQYIIDFTSTQTCAGSSPLKLPKYHYGGLGVRGHADWDPVDKVTMLTSNGDDRIKGDSTKARWVHMGGQVDGQTTGMAILIDPRNYRFPQPLRLNPKNPQLCIAPSQDGDWMIEPGKPYVSRYRFIIADGKPDAAALEAAWQACAEPLKVTLE
jgi:hypothetical protein